MKEPPADPAPDRLTLFVSLALTLIVAALHYIAFLLIHRYAGIYAEFDGELPGITRMMIDSPLYYWIFPVLVAVAIAIHNAGYISRRLTLLFTTIGTGVSTALCVFALYLPILQLGSMVLD